jgi:hypothetical protein
MNNRVDVLLAGMGVTRRDLRYDFTWKGKRYYIPTFNPLWWVVTTTSMVGLALGFYAWVVLMILVLG